MAHGHGNGIATSDMRHNGLRKRLDVLGFTQPLPLGAVPLVGALLEDLIQTTESLKQHKDHVLHLLQEKSAWELGVEAYKCDNSKLLAEVSKLNKQIIHQNDQYQGKKCEFSKRIRNLEMDKRYLEDHLQQMGERFEELEAKYQDVLDPRRKALRKPFVSTVKSGCFIPPEMPGGGGGGGVHNPHHSQVCPSRCPASVRRKEVELERDRLQQETVSMQDSIDMQSKQCHETVYRCYCCHQPTNILPGSISMCHSNHHQQQFLRRFSGQQIVLPSQNPIKNDTPSLRPHSANTFKVITPEPSTSTLPTDNLGTAVTKPNAEEHTISKD